MEWIEKSHRYLNSIETQYILYILPRRSTKQSHLDAVAKERTLCREVCKESREELKSVFMMNGVRVLDTGNMNSSQIGFKITEYNS